MKKRLWIITILGIVLMASGCVEFEKTGFSNSKEENGTKENESNGTIIETQRKQGEYTLEECRNESGVYFMYEDGSFDSYCNGYVLTWEDTYMTYGTDYHPDDLIMPNIHLFVNDLILKEKGQLVLFWPYENRVEQGLYKIKESGKSLFRKTDEGKLEGLFLTRGGSTGTEFTQWNQNHVHYWSNVIEYATINGIPKEEYRNFPSTEGRDFASFSSEATYVIGVVEGTAIVEKEYETNYTYFLHDFEKGKYSLRPTTDGYAIFDFSATDPGEYVFTTSYWNEESEARSVYTTYIEVE